MMPLENEPDPNSVELVNLPQLVEHYESVPVTGAVENVYQWFQRHHQEYIGVSLVKKIAVILPSKIRPKAVPNSR